MIRLFVILTCLLTAVFPPAASATDAQTTLTKETVYSTRDPSDTTAPVAQITAPLDAAELTAPTDITGTAQDTNLAYYQLLLRPAGAPDTAWTEIARGYQNITNGTLGTLDPTVLANGLYDIGLIAVDINGQQSSTGITVEITRDLKIGQFSLSFLDLEVSAAGIPCTLEAINLPSLMRVNSGKNQAV